MHFAGSLKKIPAQSEPPNTSRVLWVLVCSPCFCLTVPGRTEPPRLFMLCPARGLAQSRGDTTELHILVSEKNLKQSIFIHRIWKGMMLDYHFNFLENKIRLIEGVLTHIEDMDVLQGTNSTTTSTDQHPVVWYWQCCMISDHTDEIGQRYQSKKAILHQSIHHCVDYSNKYKINKWHRILSAI